ncbi:DNA-binding response regulator [Salipaludibacillus neizhouensis]|uniref:DNA-binding response regulator n=1 Tax=Salipaludibacillus neizhouensis TaxID=885475 RepID=A0A3A9K9E6_9BACI|nr:LytTR family DNA-binding domain-containing protein [Salipaludibacillus neizhouensis]RKL67450.1 DNA-binding response regulator [Salipaludibacillus neizhouensis]
MKRIRVVVVDDEPYSRDEILFLLGKYQEVEIIGEADSGEKALGVIMRKSPDVVFIDIEMPQMSGMELAHSLKSMKKVPLIVFATAYPDYAAKAFRVQALDYILKPFDEEQLEETMLLIKDRLIVKETPNEKIVVSSARLAVEDEGKIVYLSPNEITYLFREERETMIRTTDSQYSMKMPLKDIEMKLKNHPFFRTHKSYLVNIDRIEELIPWFNGAYQVKVEGSTEEIPVSRNYVKALRERLEL